jgi:hypothetical protein
MEKVLSEDQRRLGEIYTNLKTNAAWEDMVERLSIKIDDIESILLGKTKIRNQEVLDQVENLDDIKYSMNSILRKELQTLKELVEYPDKVIKSLGYYKNEDTNHQ